MSGFATNPPAGFAPAFIGRAAEFAALTQALTAPTLVLVEGEAGVGKSRLVREFIASAPSGQRVVLGSCSPHPEPLPLAPLVTALRPYQAALADRTLSGLAGALRPLFPEWADQLPPAPEPLADPKAARHRLFRALAELLGQLEISALVIEDAHWAEVATLEFLLFLTTRPGNPPPISLIVTYRPEDLPACSLLLRLSSRRSGSQQLRVPVRPLDQPGTARLVSSMLGDEPVSDGFAELLQQRTDGVPLLVEESVRLLRARGDLVRRGGEWVRRRLDELAVPPTVQEAVLARLPRLSQAAQQVLAAAAVLAEPAGERLLAQVAGLTEPAARAGLTEGLTDGMLREDAEGRNGFRHILMGQAVYQAIPNDQRRALHQRAGELLAQTTPAPLAALTRHFRCAGQISHWTHYAEATAERASESGDYDAAAGQLTDLLQAPQLTDPVKIRLARKLALVAVYRREALDDGHRQVIETLRHILATVPLTSRQDAELRSGFGGLLAQLGDYASARAELERAIPHLAHDPVQAARAMRLLGLPFAGDDPVTSHRRWLQRAAEIDPATLPPTERLALLVDRAGGLLQVGDEAGWALAEQLPADGDSVDVRRQIARGCLNVAVAAILWGRYPLAGELLARARDLTGADRLLRLRPLIQLTQVQLDWHLGAWGELPAQVAAAADPASDSPLRVLTATRIGLWQLAQGALRKAESELTEALAGAGRVGTIDDGLEPSAGLGRLYLLEDRVGDALRLTEQPMQTIVGKQNWLWATELAPVRVAALLAAGQHTAAEELVSAYRDGLRGCQAAAGHAALATCRALLAAALAGTPAGHARAAARFAAAARAYESLPRPYEALQARERQAHCQLAAGAAAAGLARLGTVFQALCELGARGDADRVTQRLREHGVDARREWRRGRRGYGDQLSPRELDVVRLVATGATNREVASALSRSPKTVAGQLSSAMRKLGATSRTELAVDALRTGLTDPDPPPRSPPIKE